MRSEMLLRIHLDASQALRPPSKEEWTYSIGNKVKHPTFGDGIVNSIEGSGPDPVLTIAFKNKHGIKKLLASMAKLKKL